MPSVSLGSRISRIALGFLLLAPVALAQPKPPPPVYQEPQGPPPPDIEGFKRAYERAKEPNMLVICGYQKGPDKLTEQTATGIAGADNFVGANLSLFDTTGDSVVLKNQMEECLRQAGVDVVSLDALTESSRRDAAMFQMRNDTRGALELLAKKVNADIVIVIRMLDSRAVHQTGVPYRVSAEMLSVTRGRKIGGVSGFDWRGDTDAKSIKYYSEQITRKLFDDFQDAYRPARGGEAAAKYTLRLLGVADPRLVNNAVKAFKGIEGVSRVKAGAFSSTGRDSIATIDITYAGEALALMGELQDVAEKELGYKVEGTDGNFGAFTLIAKQAVASEKVPPWQILMNADHPDHKRLADAVINSYKLKGSPKLGIFVNREPTEQEKRNNEKIRQEMEAKSASATTKPGDVPGPNGSSGVMVVLNLAQEGANIVQGKDNKTNSPTISGDALGGDGAGKPGKEKVAEALLDTRSMEDKLFKKLNSLGFQTVDPNIARNRLQQQADKARVLYNDGELPFLLGQAAGVDTVILGVGQLNRNGGRFDYTFRVVRVTDGTVLAAETLTSETFDDANFEGKFLDLATDFIAGNLATQMQKKWEPPNIITISVQNVKTLRDLDVICKFFKDNVPGVDRADFIEQDSGVAGGRAEFRIEYKDTPEKLNETLISFGDKLPFDLDADRTTRDTITLKLRDRR